MSLRKPRDALGKGLGKPRESTGVPRKGSGGALKEALGEAWRGWGVLGRKALEAEFQALHQPIGSRELHVTD